MSGGIIEQFINAFTDPGALVGHFAYVLLIVSMMMRSMNWLRFFAILAGTISSIYYWILSDYVSMFWEALFSLVNVAQLIILQIENRRGKFSDEENLFIRTCLKDIERAHARRLVKIGAWTEVQDDAVLITQDTCPEQLKFLVSGEARVERGRRGGEHGAGFDVPGDQARGALELSDPPFGVLVCSVVRGHALGALQRREEIASALGGLGARQVDGPRQAGRVFFQHPLVHPLDGFPPVLRGMARQLLLETHALRVRCVGRQKEGDHRCTTKR